MAGPHTAASASVVTLPLSSPLTHILGFLSLSLSPLAHPHTYTHTAVNSFNSPAVPPLPLQRGEMNDFSELPHLSQAVPVRTGFQPINEEVSRTQTVSSLAGTWGGWPTGGGRSCKTAHIRKPFTRFSHQLQAHY